MLKGIGEEATYFYHPDHLGSVSVVSNHKGVPYERVEYLPFGEVWIEDVDPATRYIPFRFTSKELDRETGLYYYGARYYEPKVSRWMSADPAGFALINPNRGGYSVIEATNWYSYTSNNPVKYVDPTGMWINNGDGTFTAEKGDTLWGLSQETGKSWKESDYKRDPKNLQIGETVDMGKRSSKPSEDTPVISNTREAFEHYRKGDGEPAWLDDNVLDAIRNSDTQQYKERVRFRQGETPLAEGNYKIDLVGEGSSMIFGEYGILSSKELVFLGETRVDYTIYSGTTTTIVDFTVFGKDGFWDITPGSDDGLGPAGELRNRTPYTFIERSWTISISNPPNMNWKSQ